MSSIDLRRLGLRPGEVRSERLDVELEPFLLGGQRYEAHPETVPVDVEITQASDTTVFDLRLHARLAGPCMRCLGYAEVEVDATAIAPMVTWGTTPGQVVQVTEVVPDPLSEVQERALRYMDLRPGTPIQEIALDRVFIGSCTNSRISDLREAASVVAGRKVARTVNAMVVPGSAQVKQEAEAEGLDAVFRAAGFDWRSAGCSMCLGMNPDILSEGERCASTSNRNFEGRQGKGGRTHLVSPKMAAAAAIEGPFVDIREWS